VRVTYRVAALVVLSTALVHASAAQAQRPAGFRVETTGPAGGEVWRGVIPGAVRASMIYVPPGYSTSTRYDVAYLLPGMPGSPWSYVNSLSLAAVADTLIANHVTRPFVAVMPVAGPSGHYNGEWAGPWENYVVRDVVPWVDASLPTVARRQGRVLAGLSAGGFGAADIGLRHPGLFGTIEAWGGYFTPFHDGPFARATAPGLAAHDPTRLLPRRAARLRALGTRFFLSSGRGHGRVRKQETARFAELLAAHRIPVRLELLATKTGAWERQLVDGLRWAFAFDVDGRQSVDCDASLTKTPCPEWRLRHFTPPARDVQRK